MKPKAIVESRVEAARETDLESIVSIDRLTLQSKAAEQVYAREVANEISRLDVVVELGGAAGREIVAFINYWLVADEVHLLSVATRPDRQRRGLGRQMMSHLLAFARSHGARCITLEVRASNAAARELYRSLGFEIVSVRRNYYADTQEDAIVMLLALSSSLLD